MLPVNTKRTNKFVQIDNDLDLERYMREAEELIEKNKKKGDGRGDASTSVREFFKSPDRFSNLQKDNPNSNNEKVSNNENKNEDDNNNKNDGKTTSEEEDADGEKD